MKILILSCSTGGEHNSAAKALQSAFVRKGAECDLYDMHALISERRKQRSSAIYNFFAVYAPHAFGCVYALAGKISHPRGRSPVYLANIWYARPICKLMQEEGYDAVVCTHLFPAEAITRARRKYGLQKKFYFVATDYTCSPFNEETKPDAFFIPHADLAEEYRGMSDECRIPCGIPVDEKFFSEDRSSARESLQIPEDKQHILIMCGSMGFGKVERTLKTLRGALGEKDFIYTVLGGHNARLKARLRRVFGGTVRVVDFTDCAYRYMRSADVLFTKPGGLTSTEAAAIGIPIVHTAPIPGCESKNLRFFRQRGMSLYYRGKRDLAAVVGLIRSPAAREQMCEAQRNTVNPHAAEDICEHIMRDIA